MAKKAKKTSVGDGKRGGGGGGGGGGGVAEGSALKKKRTCGPISGSIVSSDDDSDVPMGAANVGDCLDEKDIVRDVVIVDGIVNPAQYSRIGLRTELRKFFPDVGCRAFFQANGGLRIFDFSSVSDVDRMCTIDWNAEFGDRGKPFGGVRSVNRRVAGSSPPLGCAVRLRIDNRITEEEFLSQFSEQTFGKCDVSFLRRKDGRFFGVVKLTFAEEVDGKRAVERGVFVGYSRVKGVYWSVGTRASQCFNCHGFGHFRSVCRSATRCARCGGGHDIKLCVSRHISCPNCSGPHFAWNDSCAVAVAARRRASAQLGFPPPRVSRPVPRQSRVDSLFVDVARGRLSGSVGSPVVADPLPMARDLALHVVSFLSESFRKVVDVLLGVLRPLSSVGSPSGASPPGSCAADVGDPLVRFLSALQTAFSSVVTQGPNG
jgi:hypothetical protein